MRITSKTTRPRWVDTWARYTVKWYWSAAICVHYQCSCAPKLARKYEIEHWSQSGKTINWSAYSFRINHVTLMSWHMSLQCGHVMLVSGYPVLIPVNWPYCECPSNIKDVDLRRHAWDILSVLLIVSPTPPVQSVDADARLITWQPNEKRLTMFYQCGAGLSSKQF